MGPKKKQPPAEQTAGRGQLKTPGGKPKSVENADEPAQKKKQQKPESGQEISASNKKGATARLQGENSEQPTLVKKKKQNAESGAEASAIEQAASPPSLSQPLEISAATTQELKAAEKEKTQPFVDNQSKEPTLKSKQLTKAVQPKLPYPPATFTGFRELRTGQALFILLLWLPRLFIPWVTALHEFDVYLLSNPWRWKEREGELQLNRTLVLLVKYSVAILCSVLVDVVWKMEEMKQAIYVLLLALFVFCPAAGGAVNIVLRAQFREEKIYFDWWVTSIVVMQYTMSVAFIMFPVQFACIFSQNSKMSKNAHYNWTLLLVLVESLNGLAAFLAIPRPCPSAQWIQITTWAGIFLLLTTVAVLTMIIIFSARVWGLVKLKIFKRKAWSDIVVTEPQPFIDVPADLMRQKLQWFALIAIPVSISSFSFGILERFATDDDWDNHWLMSARGFFLSGKAIGVVLMGSVMFVARKVVQKRLRKWNVEMMYLGLPHALLILALLTITGRISALSNLKVGDTIGGPLPDEHKAILIFTNSVFRNRTVCISSEQFHPVRVKPRKYMTRELYDDMDEINVTITVDPFSNRGIEKSRSLRPIKKGEWGIYDVSLAMVNDSRMYVWDYYEDIRIFQIHRFGQHPPRLGPPQLEIFQRYIYVPPDGNYFELNHTSGRHVQVFVDPTNGIIYWEAPATGVWTIRPWSDYYVLSDKAYAWVTNCTSCSIPLKLDVENNSLYLVMEYIYEEGYPWVTPTSYYLDPPPGVRSPVNPFSYEIFLIATVVGPNNHHSPSKKEVEADSIVKVGMAMAGMAASGMFLGFVYLFWVDPPIPRYRTITLAACWVLTGLAADVPQMISIDVSNKSLIALMTLQVFMAASHFAGFYFMQNPKFNFRIRLD